MPQQFSWVDQRLVRDGFIEHRSAEALALYLFLITVGDAQGLSYYSDPTLCGVIGFSPSTLSGHVVNFNALH